MQPKRMFHVGKTSKCRDLLSIPLRLVFRKELGFYRVKIDIPRDMAA